MANQSNPVSAIPLAEDSAAPQLESAGQVILKLLHKAAGAAEANSRRALAAQELSTQLQAAHNRIAELEAEVQLYREKSKRAEEWLRKISTDPKSGDGNHRGFELSLMGEDEQVRLGGSRSATLQNGALPTDFPTLKDAIRAWHRIRPEQARGSKFAK
jgi:hypothetical protein